MNTLAIYGGKPSRKKLLVFGNPLIEKKEINEVVKTLKSGWVGTGPKTDIFETMFKNYIGSKYAVALNSCTAAIHLALLAVGLRPGDEVITTPMTFSATAAAIIHAGGKPVFADVEKDSMNIDPKKIEEKITNKTRVILPVHLFGRPVNLDKIKTLAKSHNLLIIEDAAHAIGASYKGKKIGTFADITCFSFSHSKNITTVEGGMITTDKKEYADKIKIYGKHGQDKNAWNRYSNKNYKSYQIIFPGFEYRMTDIQASLGIYQLKRIEKYQKRREVIWKKYNRAFEGLPIIVPKEAEMKTKHARNLYTILLRLEELTANRDTIMNALYHENIGVGLHFLSLHLHPYYQKTYNYKPDDFPQARYISERTISLPLSPKLKDNDIEDVINAVKKVICYYKK